MKATLAGDLHFKGDISLLFKYHFDDNERWTTEYNTVYLGPVVFLFKFRF